MSELLNISEKPDFNQNIKRIQTGDPVHAEFMNQYLEILLNNEIFLKNLYDMVNHSIADLQRQATDREHTHDDRYYTEVEVDNKLADKAATGHDHDTIYYNKNQIDSKVSETGHNHNSAYYTKVQTDAKLENKSATVHNHDERYYTEVEINNLLAAKATTSHNHDSRYYTEAEVNNLLANKTNSNHNHDTAYYTKTQTDTKLAAKSPTTHYHDERYYTEAEINTKLASKANTNHTHSEYVNRTLGVNLSSADSYKETGYYFHIATSKEISGTNNTYLPYMSTTGNVGDVWMVDVIKYNNQWSINKYYQIHSGRRRMGECLIDHTNKKRYWFQRIDSAYNLL